MSYFKERDENNFYKLRDLLDELPDFCKEFFIGTQHTTSVLTRLNYAYDLRIFFDYLAKKTLNTDSIRTVNLSDLENLKSYDLELFLDYLTNYSFNGRKYTSGEHAKERKLSSLRSFFKYFYNKDKLSCNIAAKVAMPKIHEKGIIRLETDEVARLLDEVEGESDIAGFSKRQNKYRGHTKTRDLAIITLFLGTGIRISELVGLDRTDIDFENLSFKITRKGGSQTILYFSPEIAKTLKKYLSELNNEIEKKTEFGLKIEHSPALFFSLQARRISLKAVQDLVKKYSRQIAPLKRITPHKLRSTFGTELYRNTHDIYVVAEVLGHKDINTTKKHYAAISDDIRRAAANTVVLRDSDTNLKNADKKIAVPTDLPDPKVESSDASKDANVKD